MAKNGRVGTQLLAGVFTLYFIASLCVVHDQRRKIREYKTLVQAIQKGNEKQWTDLQKMAVQIELEKIER